MIRLAFHSTASKVRDTNFAFYVILLVPKNFYCGAKLSRMTRAALHLSIEAVQANIQCAPSATQRRHWLIVYNALVDPRPAASVALHTEVSVATVRHVIASYNRGGPAALTTPGKGAAATST